jgi:hypothetical protein
MKHPDRQALRYFRLAERDKTFYWRGQSALNQHEETVGARQTQRESGRRR